MENTQKIENRTTILPRNSTSEYLSKGNKNHCQKDIHTHMFVSPLFTVAKTWKQPVFIHKEWIKKMLHTHTEILFTHIKKENPAFYDNMDGP